MIAGDKQFNVNDRENVFDIVDTWSFLTLFFSSATAPMMKSACEFIQTWTLLKSFNSRRSWMVNT
jgi:hypothetical protein